MHACRGQPLVRGEIVLPCGVRPIFDVIAVPDGVPPEACGASGLRVTLSLVLLSSS